MAFFDKLNQVAKSLGDMTSDAIETSKLNGKVAAERLAATEQLTKIGEHYYNKFLANGEVDSEVIEFCNKAKEHMDLADATQAEIDQIKLQKEEAGAAQVNATTSSSKCCPSCGMTLGEGVKFCQGCGTKIEEIVENKERVCSGCGATVPAGVKFCQGCGTKIEEVVENTEHICSGCGATVAIGVKFCSTCGQKMEV